MGSINNVDGEGRRNFQADEHLNPRRARAHTAPPRADFAQPGRDLVVILAARRTQQHPDTPPHDRKDPTR